MGRRAVFRHADWTLGLATGPTAPPKLYALNCAACQETSPAGPDRAAVEAWAFSHADEHPHHQRYPLAASLPFLVSPARGNPLYTDEPPAANTDGFAHLVPTPEAEDARAWWTLSLDFSADALPPLYGLECVTCGEAPERTTERDPLETWALTHTARNHDHRAYVAATVTAYRAFPVIGNPIFEGAGS